MAFGTTRLTHTIMHLLAKASAMRLGVLGRCHCYMLAVMIALLLLSSTAVAGTIAGSQIEATAKLTYHLSSRTFQVSSSQILTIVRPVSGIKIDTMAEIVSQPGRIVTWPVVVQNTGNIVDTFSLSTHAWEPAIGEATWYVDVEQDGQQAATDLPLNDTDGDGKLDTGPLSPGSLVHLLYVVTVPSQAQLQQYKGRLQVVSNAHPEVSAAYPITLVLSEAVPYVSVSGHPTDVYAGSTYQFQVFYGNTGNKGVNTSTLRVPLAAKVTYIASNPNGNYDAASHTLSWDLGNMQPGTTGAVTITVAAQADTASGTEAVNRAALYSASAMVASSTASTRIVTKAPTRIGLSVMPEIILGDGLSVGTLTATVTDVLGNVVDDATEVSFTTAQGHFVSNGQLSVTMPTARGIATAQIVAPLLAGIEPVMIPVEVTAGNPKTGLVREQITIRFSPGAVVGRLIDSATGLARSGVEVRLMQNGNVITTAYTDEYGYYQLIAPAIGTYDVMVVDSVDETNNVVFQLATQVDEVNDAITLGPSAIQGQLLDSATGLGLANAQVDLYDDDGKLLGTTTTDAQGYFYFTNLTQTRSAKLLPNTQPKAKSMRDATVTSAKTQATVEAAAVAAATTGWTIKAIPVDGRTAQLKLPNPKAGDIMVALKLKVDPSGRVLDALTKRPIPNASVGLEWVSQPLTGQLVALPNHAGVPQANPTTTNNTGFYRFHVNPGYYRLRVTAPGYTDYLSSPMLIQGEMVSMDVALQAVSDTDLTVTKLVDNNSAEPGDKKSYALRLQNNIKVPLTNVTVTDYLPTGLTYVADSSLPVATYDATNNTLTWVVSVLNPGVANQVNLKYQAEVQNVVDGTQLKNTVSAQVAGRTAYAHAVVTLDVAKRPNLSITKQANRDVAAIGDIVRYEIKAENKSSGPTPMASKDTRLVDVLPVGFVYMAGSSLIDGRAAADPIQNGNELTWILGDLATDTTVTLSYTAAVGLKANNGDGTNRVWVRGKSAAGFSYDVGPASARTRVQTGLFGSAGFVSGTVFCDVNRNGVQDVGEDGLAGVSIYTDTGYRITTGEQGRYSIEGITPGLHSFHIDLNTLPKHETWQLPAGDTLPVQVFPTGIARADFALAKMDNNHLAQDISLTPVIGVLQGAKIPFQVSVANASAEHRRRVKLDVTAVSTSSIASVELDVPAGAPITISPATSQIIQGYISLENPSPGSFTVLLSVAAHELATTALQPTQFILQIANRIAGKNVTGDDWSLSNGLETVTSFTTKTFTQLGAISETAPKPVEATNTLGSAISNNMMVVPSVLTPQIGEVFYQDHITVKVQGGLHDQLQLSVNDRAISQEQIGQLELNSKTGRQTATYYNVELAPGYNKLSLSSTSGQGVNGTTVDVYQIGPAARILVAAPPVLTTIRPGGNPQSNQSVPTIPVAVLVTDNNGFPVADGNFVTVSLDHADILNGDANPNMLGTQVTTTHGLAILNIRPTETMKESGIKLTLRTNLTETEVIMPIERSTISNLAIAGAANLTLAINDPDRINAYGSLLYIGQLGVKDVVFRYDSRVKTVGTAAQGQALPPLSIRGDTSTVDNVAKSSGPLYLRIGNDDEYLLYGDYSTSWEKQTQFTNRSGNATGWRAKVTGDYDLAVYYHPVAWARQKEALAGKGISGPYILNHYPVVPGSEVIWIKATLFADSAPEFGIPEQPLARGTDYDINYETGTIMFKEPIPSRDSNLNEVFIHVVYGTAGTGDGAVYGMQFRAYDTANSTGVTWTGEQLPSGAQNSAESWDVSVQLDSPVKTTLQGEQAISFSRDSMGKYKSGTAGMLNLGIEPAKGVAINLKGRSVSGEYMPPGEKALTPGNSFTGAAKLQVTPSISLTYDKGVTFEPGLQGKITDKVGALFNIGDKLTLGTTAKSEGSTINPFNTHRKLGLAVSGAWNPNEQSKLTGVAEYAPLRSAITHSNLSYEYEIMPHVKVGASYQQELTESNVRTGNWQLTWDADPENGPGIYGRYGLAGAMNQQENAAVLGLRHTWQLLDGLYFGLSGEGKSSSRQNSNDKDASIAGSWSLKYLQSPNFKVALIQNIHSEMKGTAHTTSLTLDGKLSASLSYLLEVKSLQRQTETSSGRTLAGEITGGLAYRSVQTNANSWFIRYKSLLYTNSLPSTAVPVHTQVNLLAADFSHRLNAESVLTATVARKQTNEDSLAGVVAGATTVQLAQLGVSLPVGGRYDLELFGRKVWDSLGQSVSGTAAEFVVPVTANLGVSLGVSTIGLDDPDLKSVVEWPKGLYTRLRVVF